MIVFFVFFFFFFNDTATTEIYTLSLHDALPICRFLWFLVTRQLCIERYALSSFFRAFLAEIIRMFSPLGA